MGEIAALLQEAEAPVLSVHANRDVAACLCTGQEEDVNRAHRLIRETLCLAEALMRLCASFISGIPGRNSSISQW